MHELDLANGLRSNVNMHELDLDNGLRSNVNMPIKSQYRTFILMIIVMFALSLFTRNS